MTGTQLAALIRKKTRTNSTTFSDADMLVDANIFKDELAGMIQQVREEIWNIPTLDDLVADQREYAYPSETINGMVNFELKFTASGNYVLAKPIARHHFADALQESKIVNEFSNDAPRYFVRRKAIYILSGTIIAVTNGIRKVYDKFPSDLSNLTGSTDLSIDPSTTTHGFPREFHELLARRVSIEYKDRNGVKLSAMELNYERDLDTKLDNFQRADKSEVVLGALPAGDTVGDDGYDY